MVFVAAWLIAGWVLGAVLFKGRLEPVRLSGGWAGADVIGLPRTWATPSAPVEPAGWQVKPSDVLLPTALATWVAAVRMVNPDRINDWGLFPALPLAFFVALGLLVVSIVLLLVDRRLSPVRLALHLVALVVVLHATVPLVFAEPNYPWVYKHIGVTDYINLHGQLKSSIDIYQNWPAFFAVAAWFSKVAGVGSPLAFAKWAPLYFNLLIALEVAFVFRLLPVDRRVRWLAMFVVAGGNWVGQDYFAPQALAYVLSLAVFGLVLALYQSDRANFLVRYAGRLAGRVVGGWLGDGGDPEQPGPGGPGGPGGRLPLTPALRYAGLVILFGVYAVVVVTHQLSPFMVLLGVGIVAQAGLIRPKVVVAGLAALAVGYFLAHLAYLKANGDLLSSPFSVHDILHVLKNPFDNAHSLKDAGTNPMTGRRITALGAPALILGLWALGAVGAVRRALAGKPILLISLLAGAPACVALVQNYGGEAIFRIYLFSLPWTAVLAASAVAPRLRRWGALAALSAGAALAVVLVLFMSAFYGSVELYRVRPGAVTAMEYFYDHAVPGSTIGFVAPNVPGRISARYDEYLKGSTPPVLSTLKEFQHRQLGAEDIPRVSALYQAHVADTPGDLYLYLSSDQAVYTEVLGLMPKGAVTSLDRALTGSARWDPVYRNADATVFRFVPDSEVHR